MKSHLNTFVAVAALLIAPNLFAHDDISSNQSARKPEAKAQLLQTVPPWVNRAHRLGSADDSKRVLITAYLSWRNPSELEQLLRDRTDPASPRYGQFLTPEQFHTAFSPRGQDVRFLQDTLQGLGFNVEYTPDSGLFVRASGTVAQVKQAFHVSQDLYSYRGKTLRAHAEDPSIPAALSGVVTYIAGLDDSRKLTRPLHVSWSRMSAQPNSPSSVSASQQLEPPYGADVVVFPCSDYWGDSRAILEGGPGLFPYGTDLPWAVCGYTPEQVQQAYGVNHTYERGRGVRVAITDLYASPTLASDVNRYSANHGLPPLTEENFGELLAPNVNSIPAGDPCSSTSWLGEQTLDVTAVHSIAPEAYILYVGGTCDDVDMVDGGVAIEPTYEVIDHRLADIVSTSWGYDGEVDLSAGQLAADNAKFIQAAIEGISIVNADGDLGDNILEGLTVASGNWPSTSPFVTAVGGTSLLLRNDSGEKQEYPWASWYAFGDNPLINPNGASVTVQGYPTSLLFGGGSGGGPSLSQTEPFYQLAVVPKALATQTVDATGAMVVLSPPKRVTPDISMVADGFGGLLVGETYLISSPPVDPGCTATSVTTEYCEGPSGGTSLSAPLFAGVLALANEARCAHHRGPVGFVNPALYRLRVGEHWQDDAPIIKVNAPTTPIGQLFAFKGTNNFLFFAAVDSNLNSSSDVVYNVDTSLLSRPEYDSATGLGAPNVPPLIRALSEER